MQKKNPDLKSTFEVIPPRKIKPIEAIIKSSRFAQSASGIFPN